MSPHYATVAVVTLAAVVLAALFVTVALKRLWLDCIDFQNEVRALGGRVEKLEQKYSRVAQPCWRAAGQFLERAQHEVTLLNLGAPAIDVSAESDGQEEARVIVSAAPVVKTGESVRLRVVFDGVRPTEFRFALVYRDALRERQTLWVTISEIAVTLSNQGWDTPEVEAVT